MLSLRTGCNTVVNTLKRLKKIRLKMAELRTQENALLSEILRSYEAGEWECLSEEWDKAYGWQKGSFLYFRLEKNENALLFDEFNWRDEEKGKIYHAKLIEVKSDITLEFHEDNEFYYQDLVLKVQRGFYMVIEERELKELGVVAYHVCWIPQNGRVEVIKDEKLIRKVH
ncbi:protein of unknown function (plasmid) [Thermococcus nautili]|nr:protein of unknown function [Thermococcus nautili]